MENADKLKDFIDLNREQFDEFEPSSDIWDKIHKKQIKNTKRLEAKHILLKVAVAIVFLIGVYFVFDYGIIAHGSLMADSDSQLKTEAMTEFQDAQTYYSNEINTKLAQLEIDARDYPEIWSETKNELLVLDKEFKQLQRELQENVSHEDVVGAIIQNYKFKLQIIDQINEIINEQEAQKKTMRHDI